MLDPRTFLRSLFDSAIAAVDAERTVPRWLPDRAGARTVVVAAGKAAAAMAAAVERHHDGPLEGIAITRYGHGVPCERVEVLEAGHPLPDASATRAAQRLLHTAEQVRPNDVLLGLWSGGGSSLLTLPLPGLELSDVRKTTEALLRSGASIREINIVRRHLSSTLGGRLAVAAAPAEIVGIAISDVVDDDPTTIASGPTVPDPSTRAEALGVLRRHRIRPPQAVLDVLGSEVSETAKPDHPAFRRATFSVCASARDALSAAERTARGLGVHVRSLGHDVTGDSSSVAVDHARFVRSYRGSRPVVFLSGGETTVTVAGDGHGGPNREYALALAMALGDAPGVHALACDTDGIDGIGSAAGAYVGPRTIAAGRAAGLDPRDCLRANDSGRWFETVGDAIFTGPTRTNVNDFRAILVLPAER